MQSGFGELFHPLKPLFNINENHSAQRRVILNSCTVSLCIHGLWRSFLWSTSGSARIRFGRAAISLEILSRMRNDPPSREYAERGDNFVNGTTNVTAGFIRELYQWSKCIIAEHIDDTFDTMSGLDSATSLDRRNQFISPDERRKKTFFSGHRAAGIRLLTMSMCSRCYCTQCDVVFNFVLVVFVPVFGIHRHWNCDALFAVGPAPTVVDLSWPNNRTVNACLDAKHPHCPSHRSLSLSLSSSFILFLFRLSSHRSSWSSRHRHRIRCEVDLSLLPCHRTLFARRGIEGGISERRYGTCDNAGNRDWVMRVCSRARYRPLEREREREEGRWFCLRDEGRRKLCGICLVSIYYGMMKSARRADAKFSCCNLFPRLFFSFFFFFHIF